MNRLTYGLSSLRKSTSTLPACAGFARGGAALLLVILSVISLPARTADVTVTFEVPEQAELYHALLKEYRCLKCQNQNLADSHASLADDLRREIREQILDGKNKADIDAYLVARYGEFVFYRPRFNSKTWVLWLGPFVLLLIGLGGVFLMVKKRSSDREHQVASLKLSTKAIDEHEARLERARQLLDD